LTLRKGAVEAGAASRTRLLIGLAILEIERTDVEEVDVGDRLV
jgi:hypothetical protein